MLNQWTEQATPWISMAQWDLNEHPLPKLEGRECHAGLDLSTTTDLSCLAWLPSPARINELAERVKIKSIVYDPCSVLPSDYP